MEQKSPRANAEAPVFHRADDDGSRSGKVASSQPESAALDSIDVFMPWADAEEKALRRRLRDAWQISTARATRSQSRNARQLWWQVSQVATQWTTKRASKADLKDIADSLVRMFMAAAAFERIEVCDANA